MPRSPLCFAAIGLIGASLIAGEARGSARTATLLGTTYDYADDGGERPERAWLGRAYAPVAVERDRGPVPLLVFIHGLNRELIPYRWMGGGREGDVRRIIDGMVNRGEIEPLVVAAPSSVVRSAVSNAMTSWPRFDVDSFIDRTELALNGRVAIDRERVVVVGHSGAGCNDAGGIAHATSSALVLRAIMSIDTCMTEGLARRLAAVSAATDVIVTWQTLSWASRPFTDFRRVFQAGVKRNDPVGALRELDFMHPREPAAHDATVHLTLEKWLPRVLSPGATTTASREP